MNIIKYSPGGKYIHIGSETFNAAYFKGSRLRTLPKTKGSVNRWLVNSANCYPNSS